MRCRRALKLLSRGIDGPLASDHAAALEKHLLSCESCRIAAARMTEAWRALAVLERRAEAPDDWMRIERAAESRSKRWIDFWLWQASPLTPFRPAAVALLAGMVVLGATGGVLIARAGTARTSADSIEARVFTETLGDLPYGSPAYGLALVLDNREEKDQ